MSRKNQNEIMERYLYDVTRRLPEKQKADIEEELRTLIEDMAAEREGNGKEEKENIKAVLEELGDPAKLAMKYRDGADHLIGGIYYPMYCEVLKIVLICVAVGMAVSTVVGFCVMAGSKGAEDMIQTMQNGFFDIAAIPGVLMQAFAWVTLAFFLMERNQVRLQGTDSVWTLEKLPQIPIKKAVISKGDSVAGVVFGILVLILLIGAPQFAGAWLKSETTGEMVAISVFNLSVWNRLLPLLIINLVCGIIDDFVKLIVGCYNLTVMYVSIFCTIVSVIITVYMFKVYDVFNPHFVEEVSEVTGKTFHSKGDIMTYWNTGIGGLALEDIFMGILCLIMLIELAVTVYRTLRYGYRGNE